MDTAITGFNEVAVFHSTPATFVDQVGDDGVQEDDETITLCIAGIASDLTGHNVIIGIPSSVSIRGTNSAPSFDTWVVSAKSFIYCVTVTEFQLPTACGLPAGLVFGVSSTVTITAGDADSNTALIDEDTLCFTVSAAGITLASNLSPLTEANLAGAALTDDGDAGCTGRSSRSGQDPLVPARC